MIARAWNPGDDELPSAVIRNPPAVAEALSKAAYVSVSVRVVTPCATSEDFRLRISLSAAPWLSVSPAVSWALALSPTKTDVPAYSVRIPNGPEDVPMSKELSVCGIKEPPLITHRVVLLVTKAIVFTPKHPRTRLPAVLVRTTSPATDAVRYCPAPADTPRLPSSAVRPRP